MLDVDRRGGGEVVRSQLVFEVLDLLTLAQLGFEQKRDFAPLPVEHLQDVE